MAAGDVTRNERYADEELQRLMQEWQSNYMPINFVGSLPSGAVRWG